MEERILVVDDEKDICDILQFNLENEGYIVDVATSGEEALTKNNRCAPTCYPRCDDGRHLRLQDG